QGEAPAVPRRARAGVSTLRGGEPLRGPRAQVLAYQPRTQQVHYRRAPVRCDRPGPSRRGGGLSSRHPRPAAGRAARGQLRPRRELLRPGARRHRAVRRGPRRRELLSHGLDPVAAYTRPARRRAEGLGDVPFLRSGLHRRGDDSTRLRRASLRGGRSRVRKRGATAVGGEVLLPTSRRGRGVRPGRCGPRVSVRRSVRSLARRGRRRGVARVPEPRQHAVRGGCPRRRGYADLRASGVRILAMTAEWTGEVPTLELLNRMVTESLPLGIRSGPIEQSFQRDVYFDSADWTLRRRGVACRFRTRVDDRRILTLRAAGRWEGGAPLVVPQTFEADVAELEGEQALRGMSDPARRLRALIEPTLLMPRIAFETERRWRRTYARWFARARYEVVYVVVTVRSRRLARTFQELKLRELAAGQPGMDRVARAFQERYGLR